MGVECEREGVSEGIDERIEGMSEKTDKDDENEVNEESDSSFSKSETLVYIALTWTKFLLLGSSAKPTNVFSWVFCESKPLILEAVRFRALQASGFRRTSIAFCRPP